MAASLRARAVEGSHAGLGADQLGLRLVEAALRGLHVFLGRPAGCLHALGAHQRLAGGVQRVLRFVSVGERGRGVPGGQDDQHLAPAHVLPEPDFEGDDPSRQGRRHIGHPRRVGLDLGGKRDRRRPIARADGLDRQMGAKRRAGRNREQAVVVGEHRRRGGFPGPPVTGADANGKRREQQCGHDQALGHARSGRGYRHHAPVGSPSPGPHL